MLPVVGITILLPHPHQLQLVVTTVASLRLPLHPTLDPAGLLGQMISLPAMSRS